MTEREPFRQNRIGRTDITVSELGYGASALGNLYQEMPEDEPRRIIDEAWSQGVRYFDVAPHYGLGLAETRLGAELREREGYTLSTKVGRILEPNEDTSGNDLENLFAVPSTHRRVWDFSAAGVQRSIADSLDRLGVERIDIALVHDPDDHYEAARDHAFPELARLREQGRIGAIGAGMNQWEMLADFVTHCDLDVVVLAGRYTLLDQTAAETLLPLCQEKGVSVIAAAVFNSGILATHAPNPDARFNYVPASPSIVDRVSRLRRLCDEHGITLPQAALQFPLRHPAVASVLVGASSDAEMRANCENMRAPVPEEFWDALMNEDLTGPAWVPA
ncbi:aldo/keto reductase [Rhodococcus koreensis]